MSMSVFLLGVIVGAVLMLFVIYILLFNPFDRISPSAFVEQFQPLRLPEELRQFLKEGDSERRAFEWESCFNLSLVLHFLFQEHKDSRRLRRYFDTFLMMDPQKLQLELSDLTTEILLDGLINWLQIPVIKSVRVEDYEMSQHEDFKTLKLLIDVDYSGGFQSSVDVSMLFGRFAQLSIKISRLSGKIRLKLTREPFTHWVFAFVDMPTLEFQVDSQWQGKQVKHLIPIITQKFRRMVQRKHVLGYIKTTGLLEVTVLRCTRLNTALVNNGNSEDASRSSTRCITVLLNFSRHSISESIGLTFSKLISNTGVRSVQVSTVESFSSAERCGFKAGDVVLAVNNVPVTNERQLSKLLSGTFSELNVLVDRMIYEKSNVSLSTLNNDGNDSTLGDFDEINVPEIFENVENKNGQMKMLERGNRRRSRSAIAISSNVISSDFTMAWSKTERGCVLKKHVRLRRVRSEAELTGSSYPNSEKLDQLFITGLQNYPYDAHKQPFNQQCQKGKRMETNMTEDCVMEEKMVVLAARAAEMAAAGKARMSGFGTGTRIMDVANTSFLEFAGCNEDSYASTYFIARIRLRKKKKKSCHQDKRSIPPQSDGRDIHDLSKAPTRTLTTKSLVMNEDVVWDQSLYFDLNADTCKYLNVIVRARPLTVKARDVTVLQDSQIEKSNSQTSIYIPQVLDDCQLTFIQLSSRIVPLTTAILVSSKVISEYFNISFGLNYDIGRRKLTPKAAEESHRAGFDERLCYGDILLSFRYFLQVFQRTGTDRGIAICAVCQEKCG
ncbi:hypothetical protein DINM_021307 [Dirofilaria immitis]|nr:hypothetical protein [Dirofilaria immitis]